MGDVAHGSRVRWLDGMEGVTGVLDRLPAWARHLVLMLAAAGLAWAGEDLVPLLQHQGGLWAAVGAPLAVEAIAAGTRLTRQYGVGSGARSGGEHAA